MSGCQARIVNSHNAFHTYTCGAGVRRTIGEVGLCGIHSNVLDRKGFILVWPTGPDAKLTRITKPGVSERTAER